MAHPNTSLRRTLTTFLLALGLCLIGPAAAFAQGVEHGGLNFTIVSDDISKTANGSVPQVNANSSSSSSSTTDSSTSETAASGGGETAPTNTESEGTGEASDPASEPASEETTTEPASETTAPESDADTYQSAADLNEKGKSGQTSGKKSGQR